MFQTTLFSSKKLILPAQTQQQQQQQQQHQFIPRRDAALKRVACGGKKE
jgi:hypothetical protein